MKYLITGARGQLAKEFCKKINKMAELDNNIQIKAYDSSYIDISHFPTVNTIMESYKPNVVINCASYNNVEFAEVDDSLAYQANVLGVANLSYSCNKIGALLVHFSSDYVFDGMQEGVYVNAMLPYNETDCVNPINKYGLSKLQGEKMIQTLAERYLIFRTSWLYGNGNQNFVYKFLQWCQESYNVCVSDDEISVPTSCETVVDIVFKCLKFKDTLTSGLYHLTNSGMCSRYEFAKEIVRLKGLDNEVISAGSQKFNYLAKRPQFSAMDNKKIQEAFELTIPTW